jgi:hypothetical protein
MGHLDAVVASLPEVAPIRVAHWECSWPVQGTRRIALAVEIEGVQLELMLSRESARQLRRDLKDGVKWLAEPSESDVHFR